jgi:hypothetical protein
MSKEDKIIIVAFLFVVGFGISIYFNFVNKADLKHSKELNDILSKQVEEMFFEQKKQLTIDSLKYVNAIDSLNGKIKLVQIKRKNDINKLQSEISKINSIVDSSGFAMFNDSIKMCCTNNSN